MKKNFLLLAVWLLGMTALAQDYDVTFKSLLRDMTDPAIHAKWIHPSYICRQASSYDRSSVTPETAKEDGAYRPESGRDWAKGWFDNHDFGNFLRTEEVDGEKQYVLQEDFGPGCLVRIWFAFGGVDEYPGGLVRIFLDGSTEPVIEMDSKRLTGSNGLVGYPFSFYAPAKSDNDTWRGNNLFLPIPYAKGCKVTYSTYKVDGVQPGSCLYYQINYRTYEDGTKVESFDQNTLNKYKHELYACSTKLVGSKGNEGDQVRRAQHVALNPGNAKSISVKGEKCITSLSIKLNADDISLALDSTFLQIEFDGEETVNLPVGRFYGIGTRQLANKTFYSDTRTDGMMTAYWAMPFGKSAKVTLVNKSDQKEEVALLQATYVDSPWDPETTMYFYASWCQSKKVDCTNKFDYNYVSIKGRGRYVADGLTVYNYYPDMSSAGWWGEGDEKIFVDGEKFPSHFGTGTEDYYSYAYCRPQPFSTPWVSQPLGEGNKTPGLTINNRYRLLDDIPFNTSLDFYMEIWHPYYDKMDYSPATFWYAFRGCTWEHTTSDTK